MQVKKFTASSRDGYRQTISQYATQGYTVVSTDADSTLMSRRKPFNWVLAIVCLFIPIIGWIALFFMLGASKRGANVVEITYRPVAAAASPRAQIA